MDGQDNSDNLRVASFSAYLSSTDENFVLNLAGAIQNSTDQSISPEETVETPRLPSLTRLKSDQDGEIGVFDADSYFNTKLDYETPKPLDTGGVKIKHGGAELCRHQRTEPTVRSSGTPSVYSKSSGNSHAAFLPSFPRNPSEIKQKKAIVKGFFAGFGCNGLCLNKKSVHVDATGVNHGQGMTDHRRKDLEKNTFRFSNPVPFDGEEDLSHLTVRRKLEDDIEGEEPRFSINVFASSRTIKKGDIAMNLEKKRSVLTWDAIPNSQNIPSTTVNGGICDDIQSDASSDLFEIDTHSGGSTDAGHHPMMTSENVSCCILSPTATQYEPSEVSIDWSVVTASIAEVSVVSDYDEKEAIEVAGEVMSSRNSDAKMVKPKRLVRKEGQKGRPPGGLLGCGGSLKAVSVSETVNRANGKTISSMAAAGKIQGHNVIKDSEFAPVQRRLG
ncbi:hypothetical protein U1Q18_007449 [Sarracenia purpurea var. burkii]